MKHLKLKSILFSLMAISMVTVFLSSCEKNSELNNLTDDIEETEYISEETRYINIPENMSSEDSEQWIKNLSFEELQSISTVNPPNKIKSRESCGSWYYLFYDLNVYQGCHCTGHKARFITHILEVRNCDQTLQLGYHYYGAKCKNYCIE